MAVPVFYGEEEEDSYWWVLCVEKVFREKGTPEEMKLQEAVTKLHGHARQWWLWRSQIHSPLCWDTFTTVFLWHFKPEWRNILPILDEEIQPSYESMESVKATSFLDDSVDNKFQDTICESVEEDIEESSDLCRTQREQTNLYGIQSPLFAEESNSSLKLCSISPPPSKPSYFSSYEVDDELLFLLTDTIRSTAMDALIPEPYDPGPPKSPLTSTKMISARDLSGIRSSLISTNSKLQICAPTHNLAPSKDGDYEVPPKPLDAISKTERTRTCEAFPKVCGFTLSPLPTSDTTTKLVPVLDPLLPKPQKIDSPSWDSFPQYSKIIDFESSIPLMAELQLNDGVFHPDADFVIPPKPPDQIVVGFLYCGESEFQRYINNLFSIVALHLFVKMPSSVLESREFLRNYSRNLSLPSLQTLSLFIMHKENKVDVRRLFIGAGCNRIVNNVFWGASSLVSFDAQNTVAIFSSKSAKILTTPPGHKAVVNCTHWLPTSKFLFKAKEYEQHHLLSRDAVDAIIIWELFLADKKWRQLSQGPQSHKNEVTYVNEIMVSQIEPMFASTSSNSSVCVWELVFLLTSSVDCKLSCLESLFVGSKSKVALSMADMEELPGFISYVTQSNFEAQSKSIFLFPWGESTIALVDELSLEDYISLLNPVCISLATHEMRKVAKMLMFVLNLRRDKEASWYLIGVVVNVFHFIPFNYASKTRSIMKTRMWRRGVKFEGGTANFIETKRLSDIRLSIFISQKGNVDYCRMLERLMSSVVEDKVVVTIFWPIQGVYQESFEHCIEEVCFGTYARTYGEWCCQFSFKNTLKHAVHVCLFLVSGAVYQTSAELFEKSMLYIPHATKSIILTAKEYCAFLKCKIYLQKKGQGAVTQIESYFGKCLSQVFLSLKCRNVTCQSQLLVDECDCNGNNISGWILFVMIVLFKQWDPGVILEP